MVQVFFLEKWDYEKVNRDLSPSEKPFVECLLKEKKKQSSVWYFNKTEVLQNISHPY